MDQVHTPVAPPRRSYDSDDDGRRPLHHHQQASSSSSIESIMLSPPRSSSLKPLTHSNTSNTTTSTTTTPRTHRKRMSMNFTTLPVMAPQAHMPQSPTPTGTSNAFLSTSLSTNASPRVQPRRTFDTASSSPATSPDHQQQQLARRHTTIVRTRQQRSHSSTSSTGSQDAYMSTLAAKERKVVELKDEFARVKQLLQEAERDLAKYREQASAAIIPIPSLALPSHIDEAKEPSELKPTELKPKEQELVDLTTPSSSSSSTMPKQPASAAVRPELARSRSLRYPPKEDVFNMGKRVVEELGTQFWGLFDDIRNAAVGDEPRAVGSNARKPALSTADSRGSAEVVEPRHHREPHRPAPLEPQATQATHSNDDDEITIDETNGEQNKGKNAMASYHASNENSYYII